MSPDVRGALYLDTHVAIWLRQGAIERLPGSVRRQLDGDSPLRVSPMVLFELDVLHEIRRLRESSTSVIGGLARDLGVTVCGLPFAAVAAAASEVTWTRDPFDRLIVAQAIAARARLVTRDRRIRRHSTVAYWGE